MSNLGRFIAVENAKWHQTPAMLLYPADVVRLSFVVETGVIHGSSDDLVHIQRSVNLHGRRLRTDADDGVIHLRRPKTPTVNVSAT